MTFDYASLRDGVVEPQIRNFGTAATLKQPGTPTGDDWNPTPGTPTDYDVYVLQTDFTYSERSGTLVEENDVMYLMSTEGDPDPDLQGTLTIGSDVYQVVKIKPLKPGSVILFYRVHCRK